MEETGRGDPQRTAFCQQKLSSLFLLFSFSVFFFFFFTFLLSYIVILSSKRPVSPIVSFSISVYFCTFCFLLVSLYISHYTYVYFPLSVLLLLISLKFSLGFFFYFFLSSIRLSAGFWSSILPVYLFLI